jgi:cell division protein FtsA
MDREIFHVNPQEFIVYEQDSVHDPIGMSGVRLEAKVHIITGSSTSAQNIVKCCNRAGLNVNNIMLEQLARSEAVLGTDEKELGVVVVDIGGGTTDIAVFSKGSLVHSCVLGLGGEHLTNDIAVGLRTPAQEAEKIKQKYGCALASMVSKDETIEVPSVGGRSARILSRQILAEIIEPRLEEIFSIVRQEIIKSGHEDMVAAGLVLTGGTVVVDGAVELAEQVFNMPVRRGMPRGIGGLVDVVKSPAYSTSVGLVLMGYNTTDGRRYKVRDSGAYSKVRDRMKEWFGEIF